jgi:ornithine carbamoyltransferase
VVPNAEIVETTDPGEAVTGAAVVYTDVWASMGQEKERATRLQAFAPYQVNEALMSRCPEALFMHCLPARRGEEVTDGVIDGPQSVVVEEAANRMHVQKGLIAWLLAK